MNNVDFSFRKHKKKTDEILGFFQVWFLYIYRIANRNLKKTIGKEERALE